MNSNPIAKFFELKNLKFHYSGQENFKKKLKRRRIISEKWNKSATNKVDLL